MPSYALGLRTVTPDNTTVATLSDFNLTEVEWSLDTYSGITFTVPTSSADLLNVISPDTSTWNNVWVRPDDGSGASDWQRFVPTDVSIDASRATIRCAGLGWYFSRRYVGRAGRTNMLSNGGFEAGTLSSWTLVTDPESSGVTATAATDKKVKGTYAAKLVQAEANMDSYLYQNFVSPISTIGTEWTITAWCWIDTAGWVGPAEARRGVFLQQGTGFSTYYRSDQITRETKRGRWLRLESRLWIPPSATTTDVQARIYAVGGTIWWDEVQVVAQESLSYPDSDVGTAAYGLVEHAQDSAFGKSDLGIVGVGGRYGFDTSAPIKRTWQFYDHPRISEALDELAKREAGGRWYVDVGGVALTRDPALDSATPECTIDSVHILEGTRWTLDASQAASSIVVLAADSDGPDREEGSATDLAAFGGAPLEEIIAAPTGTKIDALDALAEAALSERKRPATLSLLLSGVRTPGLSEIDATAAVMEDWLFPGALVHVDYVLGGGWDVSGDYVCTNARLDVPGNRVAVTLRWRS